MTVENVGRQVLLIRTDELERDDQVLMFGHRVQVLEVRPAPDFPTCMALVIRILPGGRARDTLVPKAWQLMGLYLPRVVPMRCQLCGGATSVEADLAKGSPTRATCGRCKRPVLEGTVVLPTVQRGRHS